MGGDPEYESEWREAQVVMGFSGQIEKYPESHPVNISPGRIVAPPSSRSRHARTCWKKRDRMAGCRGTKDRLVVTGGDAYDRVSGCNIETLFPSM